jgi:hypothetical protein
MRARSKELEVAGCRQRIENIHEKMNVSYVNLPNEVVSGSHFTQVYIQVTLLGMAAGP